MSDQRKVIKHPSEEQLAGMPETDVEGVVEQMLEALRRSLSIWAEAIEAQDNPTDVAIAALPAVDAFRRRLDKLQATPPARR